MNRHCLLDTLESLLKLKGQLQTMKHLNSLRFNILMSNALFSHSQELFSIK